MNKEDWLQEMMDAALGETENEANPDFSFLCAESDIRTEGPNRFARNRNFRRWMIPAAAALLTAAIATPLGIQAGRRAEERRISRETHEIFVESLIGKNLFEENLIPADSSDLFPEIPGSDDFFDAS